jgi:minor capsid protein
MADTLLAGLARYLTGQAAIAGLSFDESGSTGNVSLGRTPPQPDQVVTLRVYGGEEPDGKLGYDTPTVQIRVRGDQDPRTSGDRVMAIYEALQGMSNVTLPQGPLVVSCLAIQSPFEMDGSDAQGRLEHVVNFRVEIRHGPLGFRT